MRLRLVGTALFIVALSGCGGGGGGGAPGPVLATPTPTPTPARPATSGDAFQYAGTLVRAFVRYPEPGRPTPTPLQTDAQSFTSTVSQNVIVATNASFGGTTGLTDFKTAETDVQLTPAKTLTATTDAYASYPASGSGIVRAVATVTTTSDGATFTTTYGLGNGLIDVLPEVPGALVPANTAALTTTELDADTTTTSRTTNADGSYVEMTQYPDGTAATATEAADGTGTYSLPLYGIGALPGVANSVNTVLTVGKPVAATATTPALIPVTIVYAPGLFASTAVTVNRSVPLWYPPGGTPGPMLSSETYVDNGSRPLPAACTTVAGGASAGDQLVQTIAKTDTLFGETELFSLTSYVAATGVVCTQLADTVTNYYDYSGQTQRSLATPGVVLQTRTTTQTLELTGVRLMAGPRIAAIARGGTSLTTGGSFVSDSAALTALANFRATLERERLARHNVARRSFVFGGIR